MRNFALKIVAGLVLTASAMPSLAMAQNYYARERLMTKKAQAANPDGSGSTTPTTPTPAPTPTPTPTPEPAEWVTGVWSDYSSQCSPTAVRTRSVQCIIGGEVSGTVVADSECAGAKPQASQTSEIYGGCTNYLWNPNLLEQAAYWTVTGSYVITRVTSGDNQFELAAGSAASQVSIAPMEAGVPYEFKFTSNTYANINIKVIANGTALVNQTFNNAMFNKVVSFVGTGSNVTVMITSTTSTAKVSTFSLKKVN